MRWSTCALCPRLCRSACPVATGSGREAATPAIIAAAVFDYQRGRLPREDVVEHLGLCTDCGACQDHCHLHVPLPQAMRQLRGELFDRPAVRPVARIEGKARVVAIESDERPLARALEEVLGEPVARLVTKDRLGVAAIEHPSTQPHLQTVKERLDGRDPVIIDGGVAQVLEAAGVRFQWLRDVVRDLPGGHRSCRQKGEGPLRCCGGAGPLVDRHPEDAERVGRLWLQRAEDWTVRDARCRSHLRRCGGEVSDPLDALLERLGL